ncbi:MAG TPA: glycosyltransferase family 4 protein [Gemmatimonadaceae bacterium]|nr:glycosyltransferase family 4 protein [Gemmatimonadaceae bacterium]
MSRALRVVMVAACPLPHPRGTPLRVQRLAEALAAHGHDVHIVTYHLGTRAAIPGVTIHRTRNLPTYRKTSAGPSLQKLAILDPLLALRTRAVTKQIGPVDLIHAHHYEGLLAAVLASHATGAPLIYDAHTLLQYELSTYLASRFEKQVDRLGAWLDRRLPRQADYVIAVTPTIREKLVTSGTVSPDRVSVVMNGVSLVDFPQAAAHQPLSPHEGRTLIYSGGLAAYQRIDLLLRAFREVLRRRSDVRLRIASHEPLERIGQMTKVYGVHRSVSLSRVTFGELPALLDAADVALNPRAVCVGVPMKLLNYMAAAKPIVSFVGAGYPLEHGITGWLVRDNNVSEFADGICHLLDHPAVAQRLGDNARHAVASRFTWEQAARSTDDVYTRVLATA